MLLRANSWKFWVALRTCCLRAKSVHLCPFFVFFKEMTCIFQIKSWAIKILGNIVLIFVLKYREITFAWRGKFVNQFWASVLGYKKYEHRHVHVRVRAHTHTHTHICISNKCPWARQCMPGILCFSSVVKLILVSLNSIIVWTSSSQVGLTSPENISFHMMQIWSWCFSSFCLNIIFSFCKA